LYLDWKEDRSKLLIIAFSPISTFDVYLPVGNNLNLVIQIRDILDSIAEFNLSSVNVSSDTNLTTDLINSFRNSSNEPINNPLIQLISTGNQNTIGQIIHLLSEEFDHINNQTLEKAISSKNLFFTLFNKRLLFVLDGIPLTSISISSLDSSSLPQVYLFNLFFFYNFEYFLIEFNTTIK